MSQEAGRYRSRYGNGGLSVADLKESIRTLFLTARPEFFASH